MRLKELTATNEKTFVLIYWSVSGFLLALKSEWETQMSIRQTAIQLVCVFLFVFVDARAP